jgi:lipopolysaccharide biosynthesis glycosyltransferase
MRAHFPPGIKVRESHPSNWKRAPAKPYTAPRLPRSLEDKLNSYNQIIEDSDEEQVVEFTGPRSGKFLRLWHLVHEKSYSRKKNITEWQEKEKELKKEIKELKKKIVKLTPKLRQHTQKVCKFINSERIRGWFN